MAADAAETLEGSPRTGLKQAPLSREEAGAGSRAEPTCISAVGPSWLLPPGTQASPFPSPVPTRPPGHGSCLSAPGHTPPLVRPSSLTPCPFPLITAPPSRADIIASCPGERRDPGGWVRGRTSHGGSWPHAPLASQGIRDYGVPQTWMLNQGHSCRRVSGRRSPGLAAVIEVGDAQGGTEPKRMSGPESGCG